MLTPTCLLDQVLQAYTAAGDVPGSLAAAEAGENESADALQACLYLLADRQSPRLLVSAGSASSCLWCWQLAWGWRRRWYFPPSWGEALLYSAISWSQSVERPLGQFNAVASISFWKFWSSSGSLLPPEAQAWNFLVVEGLGLGDQLLNTWSAHPSIILGCSILLSPPNTFNYL